MPEEGAWAGIRLAYPFFRSACDVVFTLQTRIASAKSSAIVANPGEGVVRASLAYVSIVTVALSLSATSSFAQRRPATESEAVAYIHSAFITQADPGVLKPNVTVGPELQKA